MRVTIVTIGSLGDVQPYVALGVGLQAAGHRVRLATHTNYEALARSWGLDFFPLAGNPQEVLGSDAGRRWQEAGRNPVRFVRGFMRVIEPFMYQVLTQCRHACQDAEAIIASLLGFYAAYHIAEKLLVPLTLASYLPISPTRAYPSVMLSGRTPFGSGGFNRWTHRLVGHLLWEPLRPAVNKLRRDVLDLPPIPFARVIRELCEEHWNILYGYSPTLLPKPPDWGQRIRVTGYWVLDRPAQWQPPADVTDFLAAGPPPVYVGFGSMQVRDADAVTAVVVKALAVTRQRGVVLTGSGGLSRDNLPDGVLGVESIPHDWLFPRMAAVVHHGGAGTTAAALRAGVPSVVVPFFADQPFWGAQVSRARVGPRPIPRRTLTAERLADAIRLAATDREMKGRAVALGERIRAEDGVAHAVEALQQQWR